MQSKNMNYAFNKEYVEGIDEYVNKKGARVIQIPDVENRNRELADFRFPNALTQDFAKIPGYCQFELYSSYPGIMIGTGNPHGLKQEGVIKCGFTFDYVTGLPYLPGSSLKGMLRSYFPSGHKNHEEYAMYIRELLGMGEELDVERLEKAIFDGIEGIKRDLFLQAMPSGNGDHAKLMAMEYITPHKDSLKNPVPINLIKVKPNVKFAFCFALHDYVDGDVTVTAEAKLQLFKALILDMGIGAKTSVGFGRFAEYKASRPVVTQSASQSSSRGGYGNQGSRSGYGGQGSGRGGYGGQQSSNRNSYGGQGGRGNYGGSQGQAPMCATPGCKNRVKMKTNGKGFYDICPSCAKKRK